MGKSLGQQFNLKTEKKKKINMSVGKILKRIVFEITFVIVLIVLLPFHFIHAMILLTFEICKHYPEAIYAGVADFFYDKDDKEKNS